MHQPSSSSTTKRLIQPQPNEPSRMLGMPTYVDSPSIDDVQPVKTLETLVVMTTSFIRQHIDMWIHDIMYQVSKHLADNVKLMIHNEVQQANELEVVQIMVTIQSPIPHKGYKGTKIWKMLLIKARRLSHR